MKKISITILSLLALSGASLALAQSEKAISLGEKGDEVKALQKILSEDSSIYPEGKATGYFGAMTKRAVEKLQIKCGLPQTGIMDDPTEKCLYPEEYQVTVLSPNGGEIWDRGQTQTIKWNAVAIAPVSSSTDQQKATTQPMPPVWAKASIDLFKTDESPVECFRAPCPSSGSVFVRHIDTVNLFAGSYSWNIPSNIAKGSNYVVRITVGRTIWPMYLQDKGEKNSFSPSDVWPSPSSTWDESDNPFTVSGNVVPPSNDLSKVIEILQQMSEQLAKAIQLLREMNQIQ